MTLNLHTCQGQTAESRRPPTIESGATSPNGLPATEGPELVQLHCHVRRLVEQAGGLPRYYCVCALSPYESGKVEVELSVMQLELFAVQQL
jgi:hypothetical protein